MKLSSISPVALVAASLFCSQAWGAKGDLTNFACSFSDITNAAVSACSGFYSGNLLNVSPPNVADADEQVGLSALGLSGPVTVLEKIANTGGAPANFAQMLYGVTVIGIHFGQSAFPNTYNGNGGGTAFYSFDAGTTGLDVVTFASALAGASSGATLYMTSPVPEPETYALMLAGLGVIGFVARRRRPRE